MSPGNLKSNGKPVVDSLVIHSRLWWEIKNSFIMWECERFFFTLVTDKLWQDPFFCKLREKKLESFYTSNFSCMCKNIEESFYTCVLFVTYVFPAVFFVAN